MAKYGELAMSFWNSWKTERSQNSHAMSMENETYKGSERLDQFDQKSDCFVQEYTRSNRCYDGEPQIF